MASLGVAIVRQFERGVVFRLGKVRNVRDPGLRFMMPLVDQMLTDTESLNESAEGEALSADRLAEAADGIADHPVTLQLRNLQSLGEIAVEKNSTIIFPAQFLDSVRAVSQFIERESHKIGLDHPLERGRDAESASRPAAAVR